MNNSIVPKDNESARTSYYGLEFDRKAVDNYLSMLQFETGNLTGKTVYVQHNKVSQNKLREAGFTITRSKSKADIILITDPIEVATSRWGNDCIYFKDTTPLQDLEENILNGYKHVHIKDIYKYLYKYEGNQELFTTLNELLGSKDVNNIKLAMEMVSNANWEGNDIYLMELFNNHWNNRWDNSMRNNSYRHSISFKGFLECLEFNYEHLHLTDSTDYREYCKNDEHHEWVFNKYRERFQEQLDNLLETYKIKLLDIKYEIDITPKKVED